jgi:hypothetical protein
MRWRGFAGRSFKRVMRSIATVATAMRKRECRPRFPNRHSLSLPLGRLQPPTQSACALHRVGTPTLWTRSDLRANPDRQRVRLPCSGQASRHLHPRQTRSAAMVYRASRSGRLRRRGRRECTAQAASGSSHPCHLNRAKLSVNHARNPVAPNYLFVVSGNKGKLTAGCLTLATRSITLVTYVCTHPPLNGFPKPPAHRARPRTPP